MNAVKVPSLGRSAVTLALLVVLGTSTSAEPWGDEATSGKLTWFAFPDKSRFKVAGLFWFQENAPKLWRMPADQMPSLPKGVQGRAKCPSGGRIVLKCNSTRVAVKVSEGSVNGFDAFVNARAVAGKRAGEQKNVILFGDLGSQEKEIIIYLPQSHEVTIESIGVDEGTKFSAPEHAFAARLPMVFYGSSVCQGSGAAKAGMTYPAIACRELNLDFINLGFGGAGKAESNVVSLVSAIPACAYVFDLGKSYGAQDGAAFEAMLTAVRRAHPDVPLVCITPITSAREVKDPSYAERSVHTRAVMREAARQFKKGGEPNLVLVEGEDLLGFSEHSGLSKDGVHPSDEGYAAMARKLVPTLKKALGL